MSIETQLQELLSQHTHSLQQELRATQAKLKEAEDELLREKEMRQQLKPLIEIIEALGKGDGPSRVMFDPLTEGESQQIYALAHYLKRAQPDDKLNEYKELPPPERSKKEMNLMLRRAARFCATEGFGYFEGWLISGRYLRGD